IKSWVPQPVGSTLRTCSWNWVKLLKVLDCRRERSRACINPMRWLSSVIPIWLRKKAMIGAKSFSDQDSKSGGSGGVPDVATLHSLTVQRPESREDTIHVQYEQEAIQVTNQAANERGRLPEA